MSEESSATLSPRGNIGIETDPEVLDKSPAQESEDPLSS